MDEPRGRQWIEECPMRILVTGSRAWSDEATIRRYLQAFHTWVPARLVSGACPTGADAIAESIAAELGWEIELHPAQWAEHGRAAGFVRNAEMVDLGADLCLAFIVDHSKGATMTADRAERVGVRTIRVTV